MPDELSDSRKIELWKEFHRGNLFGPSYTAAVEKQARLVRIQNFYENDDIFRREINGLKERMVKKKMKLKEVEKRIDELASEAEYRRYIASFEAMRQNYDARKSEMAKIGDAMR